MNLFYIEDEDFLVILFEVLFKKASHLIFTTNEVNAIHFIEDQKPDMVLISLNFSLNMIVDLIDKIKKINDYSVVLVAIGDFDQISQIKEKTLFDYYITKPFTPLEVLEQLETYLKRP